MASNDLPRSQLTPEELKKKRRDDKRREYLIAIGKPSTVREDEYERVQTRLREFYNAGMSTTPMVEQSGVARDVIVAMILGVRRYNHGVHDFDRLYRSTLEKLEKIEFVPPPTDGRKGGSRLPPHGTRRRLQALVAQGYSCRFIARQMPQSGESGDYNRNLNNFIHGRKGKTYVAASTAWAVADIYDKYSAVDPVDVGETEAGVKRIKTAAKRNGFAPPTAWDDDTIDAPDAIPEWTGACGTDEGYRIHIREEIPLCEPCRRLVELDGPSRRFSGTQLRILMDQAGLDAHQVAKRAGVCVDSIRRWAWGQRRPQTRHIEALARVLDCKFNDLIEGDEEVVQDHDFNRIRFAMALEEKGLKYKALAARIGVSHMAVYYWLNGKNTPKIPKIVRAAEELGVDWKDFYR
ncbi:helix-turn-helix transcriptional regulator [Streptomyces roseolus]|uniref:helix-turn-helix transcriptional regulator n=1 Tax=Streptomyces roseolus TaxID=67358 RepID=UPI00167BEE86|nr:helix-turn-helix transcriptional regulator [Streptomyces roseolus]GGR51470.1 hypothetical protein GCM10010282_50470 [Streptomyces roseolus]